MYAKIVEIKTQKFNFAVNVELFYALLVNNFSIATIHYTIIPCAILTKGSKSAPNYRSLKNSIFVGKSILNINGQIMILKTLLYKMYLIFC